MVTKERDVVYTTDADAGPSTAMVVILSLLIVAVLGFMVYYFSTTNQAQMPTIIERNTTTTTPVPVPVPQAPAAPDINVPAPSMPDNLNLPSPAPGGSTETPSNQ